MTKFFNLKEKIKINENVKLVFLEVLTFALGFYFADIRFIFGIYPFALALLCASRHLTVFAFCGSVLSCVFLQNVNIPYLIALGAALGLRIICSLIQRRDKKSIILGKSASSSVLASLFYENTSVRVVISCFVSLGLGVYSIIISGYAFFEIFVALFFTIVSGIFTFALCGAFEGTKKRSFPLSLCAFAFIIIYGIRALEIFGLNISVVLACALVLYTSKHLGIASSASLGILLGLTAGPAFAPAIAILGLVSGFLWRTSSYLASLSAFVVAFAYGVYATGYEAIISLAPEMLLACLVMYSCLKLELLPAPAFAMSSESAVDTLILTEHTEKAKSRVNATCSTLKDISSMLKDVSAKAKIPTKQDYATLCLEVCEEHCYTCPKHSICWEKDLATTHEALDSLTEKSFANGFISSRDVGERFLHRCPNIDTIAEQINAQIKENLTQGVKNDKLEACSLDYELAAKMISAVSDEAFERELSDSQDVARLKRAGAKIGFFCDRLECYGVKTKRITAYGVNTEKTRCTANALREAYEKALGTRLSEPKFSENDGYTIMNMQSRRLFEASCFTQSCPCDGEKINGDSTVSFENTDGKYFCVLCDGMGSGQNARLTSLLSTTFLQKLLSSGSDKEIALSILNNFIRAKNGECTCTVDLLELDLISGSGKLIKSGAAPTFIKRGDNVFKLESKTMPIGIMRSLDAQALSFEVRRGDICIMLSDGVVCDESDSNHLIKLLKSADTNDKRLLCSKILTEMKSRRDRSDDMTVCAVEVE